MRTTLSSILATLALVVLVSAAVPGTASAQLGPCVCKYIGIKVSDAVACKFSVCVSDPLGAKNCFVVGPGISTKVDCVDNAIVGLVDCNGNIVTFQPNGARCLYNVPVGPGCCVDACLGQNADGCWVITIEPSAVDFCPC